MAWLVAGMVSSALLGGLVLLVAILVAQRWGRIAQILAAGMPISRYGQDQLWLPLRFAA